MIELWKPVPGYEGLYEVSNTGKVDQLARYIYRKGQKPYYVRARLKAKPNWWGYCSVRLVKDGIEKSIGCIGWSGWLSFPILTGCRS
jgi:hypothetical protein